MTAFDLKTAYANDWEHSDKAETLTVTPLAEDGTLGTPRPDVKGVRESPIDIRQLREFAAVGIEPGDSLFYLWASTLSGYVPKNGDRIKDSDNQDWSIQAVTRRHSEPRFVCPAKTLY